MGARDQDERDLYQGIIKLAAAGVHAVRGNAPGVRRNLEGARRRLAAVPAPGPGTGGTGRVIARDGGGDAAGGVEGGTSGVGRIAADGADASGLADALGRVDVAAALAWIDAALAGLADPLTAEAATAGATVPAPVSRRP